MISRSSRSGGRLAAAKAPRIVFSRWPLRNCVDDRLTDTLTSSGHPAHALQARLSTAAPISSMSPISSTIGMNSAGDTGPSRALRQRASASKPTIRLVATEMIGWK